MSSADVKNIPRPTPPPILPLLEIRIASRNDLKKERPHGVLLVYADDSAAHEACYRLR